MDVDKVLALIEAMNRENVDLEGVRVRVVSPRTLYEMKKDTVRPKDRGDADALQRRFHLPEK